MIYKILYVILYFIILYYSIYSLILYIMLEINRNAVLKKSKNSPPSDAKIHLHLPRDRGTGHFSFMRLRELRNELPEARLHGGANARSALAPCSR